MERHKILKREQFGFHCPLTTLQECQRSPSSRRLDCEVYLFLQFPQSERPEHSYVKIPWFGSLLNLINSAWTQII